ncbi:unnamed protein product, partial [Nesidiocoris tenuis]
VVSPLISYLDVAQRCTSRFRRRRRHSGDFSFGRLFVAIVTEIRYAFLSSAWVNFVKRRTEPFKTLRLCKADEPQPR